MISNIKAKEEEINLDRQYIDENGDYLTREEVVLNELKEVLTKLGELPKRTLNQKKKLKLAKDLNLGELLRVSVHSARAIDDFLHFHKYKQQRALEYERQLYEMKLEELRAIILGLVYERLV